MIRNWCVEPQVIGRISSATCSLAFALFSWISHPCPAFPHPAFRDDVQSEQTKETPAVNEEVNRWIQRLGSSDFSTREAATQKLWELGLDAKPALERASSSGDREIRFRARAILERFRLGIFVDTAPEQIRLIRRYAEANDREKQNLIRSMISEANIEDIIFLLSREANEELRKQLSQYVAGALDNLLPRLQDAGKEELIERALLQFSTTPTSQFLLASYAVSQGPNKSEQLLKSATTEWAEEEPVRLARQKVLILLLSGEVDAAIAELDQFPDPIEGRGWKNSIFLSEHRFQDLLFHLTSEQTPESFDVVPEDWLPQDLVLAVWCARVTENAEWQRALEPILTEWIKTEKLSHNQRIKLNLLTDRVNEGFEEAAETDELLAFSMLCYRDQFERAFDQFGLGLTPEARNKWYETYSDELKELSKGNQNRRQITTDESQLRIAIEAAGWLASLGEQEEAAKYFDLIFQAIPSRLANARMYQYRIMGLEFRHQLDEMLCKHVEKIFSKSRFDQSFAQLGRIDHEKYRFWWWVLETEAEEPVQRLKIIRSLLHNPYNVETTSDQIDAYLSLAEEYTESRNPNILQVGSPEVALAETCFANGLEERGIAYLARAIESGLSDTNQKASSSANQAARRLAEWHAEQERWEEALRVTNQWATLNPSSVDTPPIQTRVINAVRVSTQRTSRVDWGRVHRIKCLRMLERNSEADALLKEIRSVSYSASQLTGLARMLDEEGLSEDSTPIWKMLCYQPGKDSRPLAAYSYPAYSGLANIVFRDAQKGDPGWVESFLGYMLADNNDWYLRGSVNSMHPVSLLLNFREQVNQSKAHRAFKDGKPAVAVRYLERALRARPGNVDNVVAFVEQLTSASAEDEMDVLFDISRQLHVDVLNTFPKSAMHHNNFAWLCAKANKNIGEGLSHSLKATELRPHEDTYWDTLAEVYFQKGDYQKALELAKRCVLMDPLYPHYREQLKKYEAVISAQ
ncbi:MAG: hypothetical protein MK136_09160 [Pirellulaceae bacterium]|nr:hypothetical protein [Pirellulaceae bacterium]